MSNCFRELVLTPVAGGTPSSIFTQIRLRTPGVQQQFKFSHKENYSILSPMYIICLFEKNELILPTYKVIYPV